MEREGVPSIVDDERKAASSRAEEEREKKGLEETDSTVAFARQGGGKEQVRGGKGGKGTDQLGHCAGRNRRKLDGIELFENRDRRECRRGMENP